MEHGSISRLGKRFLWHPFTNMREWCAGKHEPLILVQGRGALLRDSKGREYGTEILLIVDEVMTGFGRPVRMFASAHEAVDPSLMILGKGLTGGYLPLAITLVSEKLFSAFDGCVADGKALAYGHSYTENALGCAATKASLEVFEKERVLEALQPKIRAFSSTLASLKELPGLKEIRQCGFIDVSCRNNVSARKHAEKATA